MYHFSLPLLFPSSHKVYTLICFPITAAGGFSTVNCLSLHSMLVCAAVAASFILHKHEQVVTEHSGKGYSLCPYKTRRLTPPN